MPISREEFDEGHIDLAVPIIDLLAGRPAEAFTANEVVTNLTAIFDRRATLGEVAAALEFLVNQGRLERKEIAGSRWYTIASANTGAL